MASGYSTSWIVLMEQRRAREAKEMEEIALAMEKVVQEARQAAGQYETNEWGEVCA